MKVMNMDLKRKYFSSWAKIACFSINFGVFEFAHSCPNNHKEAHDGVPYEHIHQEFKFWQPIGFMNYTGVTSETSTTSTSTSSTTTTT